MEIWSCILLIPNSEFLPAFSINTIVLNVFSSAMLQTNITMLVSYYTSSYHCREKLGCRTTLPELDCWPPTHRLKLLKFSVLQFPQLQNQHRHNANFIEIMGIKWNPFNTTWGWLKRVLTDNKFQYMLTVHITTIIELSLLHICHVALQRVESCVM